MILALLLQVTPVQPIVRGTALPPPGTEEAGVMRPVAALLRALETNDAAAMLAVTRPEGGAARAVEAPDGGRRFQRLAWAEFAARRAPGADRVEDRLGTPAIEIDGDIAMVWAPYTALAGGRVDHCGHGHFDLVREGGGWRVLNLTMSRRTAGCALPG